MVDLDALEPLGYDWWREQARIVGATQRQAAFARTMIENPGAKFNKVAELAGIEGTPHYLRTAGSDLAKHPKVKRLHELANAAKINEEIEIAYPPELLRQLSEIARNDTSTNNRLKANELLLNYHDRFQETSSQKVRVGPDLPFPGHRLRCWSEPPLVPGSATKRPLDLHKNGGPKTAVELTRSVICC